MHSFTQTTIFKAIVGSADVRASERGASYITAMVHSPCLESLRTIVDSGTKSLEEMNELLIACGLKFFWKIGTVEPLNKPWDRLGGLGTLIVTGYENCTTTVKMHNLVKTHGGFVLLLMYPIMDIASEPELRELMPIDHPTIVVDNLPTPGRAAPIKQNVWTTNVTA
jgi:hypothetical protein